MRTLSWCTALILILLAGSTRPAQAERPVRRSTSSDYAWVKMLRHVETFDGFERPELGAFWKFEGATGALTDVDVSHGAQALTVTFRKPADALVYSRKGLDGWGRNFARSLTLLGTRFIFHNEFKFDVHNTGPESVPLRVTIGGPFDFTLKPGWNTLTIPCSDIARFVHRMTNVTERMTYAVPMEKEVTLVFDHFRLERESVGPTMAQVARCFDFGPADTCRPGFVAVDHHTGYNSVQGFGWKTPNEKDARDALKTIVSDGRDPLGDLLRDGVQNLTSSFLVDLPNGKYRVHLVGGPRWGGIYQITPTDYDLVVRAEGEVRRLVLRASDPTERTQRFYGHDVTQYFFDEDIWTRFGKPVYDPVTFEVNVADGQLDLDFQSSPRLGRGYLNFMVIYPSAKVNAVGHELQRLWYDIRNRFCRVSYRPLGPELAVKLALPGLHPEMLKPDVRDAVTELVTSKGSSGKDVLFFARSFTDPIYPDTLPRPEELTGEVSGCAFVGGRVRMSLGMFALTELADVELKPVSLYGPGTIGSDNVDIRLVRYSRRMTAQQSRGDWQYMIVPWYHVRRKTIDFDRGMCRRVSIDVNLPDKLRPGTYRGILHLALPNDRRAAVRITVEALPRLELPEMEIDRVMVFHHQPTDRGNEAYGYSVSVQNTVGMPWAHVQKMRAMFSEMDRKEMTAEMTLIEQAGFTTLYFADWLRDSQEVNRSFKRPFELVELLPLRRQIGPRNFTVANQRHRVLVDVRTSRAYLRSLRDFNQGTVDELRREGFNIYLGAPVPELTMHETPGVNRLLAGLYPWRLGADGVVFGPFRSNWGDPYHPFDGHSGEPGSFALPSSQHWPELNPSAHMYAVSEGYTDYVLVRSIEQLARRAGNRPAAQRARRFLTELRESIDPDLSRNCRTVGRREQLDLKADSIWTGKQFDRTRTQMVEHVQALSRSLTMPP